MTADHTPSWDCRWPDPVALKVAAERILAHLPPEREGLNRALPVVVRMASLPGGTSLSQALLLTPWALERIYWADPNGTAPPIESAFPLEGDAAGRVAAGQGALLLAEGQRIPVLVGWEPETGHHFVETLLHSVRSFATVEEAFSAVNLTGEADGEGRDSAKRSLSDHLQTPTSRRGLFHFWRS